MITANSRAADIRVAAVKDVYENDDGQMRVSMLDSDTGNSFEVPLTAPGGVFPRPGDTWLLSKDLGFWRFDRCLRLVTNEANPETSIAQVMDSLAARGLIMPTFGGGTDPEAPHLAKIGEVRWFSYVPDAYWWPEADGATVNRAEYRELGAQISPGTTPTFVLPEAPILGDARPYVCAR
jgi:hypothetical protein